MPSPASGIVQQILVQEGETVEVGTKIAVIAPEGAATPAAPTAPADDAPPEAPDVDEDLPVPATQEAAAESAAFSSAEGDPPIAAPADVPPRAAQPPAPEGQENGARFVSPVVARIAAEHGVDLSQIAGTGRGGRVTKKDILGFIEAGGLPGRPRLCRLPRRRRSLQSLPRPQRLRQRPRTGTRRAAASDTRGCGPGGRDGRADVGDADAASPSTCAGRSTRRRTSRARSRSTCRGWPRSGRS